MSDNIAIKVDNVSKSFRLPHDKNTSIKSAVLHFYKRKRTFEQQQVLKDISFEIKKGQFFGIVGRNGSGKSTLLKLLAGIYEPSEGGIGVDGKLTPFIELGVGFSPELTGRENVFLNGALLGFSRKEMTAMYDEIVNFAELHRFMDQKLKNYSSGMQVRLAFSIAIRAESDILVLDEVLAVGDAAFQRKCYDYFMSLKKNSQTVVLVTHDMGAVRQYCDEAIMLEQGKIVQKGSPEKVAQAYHKLFNSESINASKNKSSKDGKQDRWGEGGIMAETPLVQVNNDLITLTTRYRADVNTEAPIYGFTIFGPSGNNILEGNTLREKRTTKAMKKGDIAEITWEIPNIFSNGRYNVSVACCDQSTTHYYDWLNEAVSFEVYKEGQTAGIVDPQIRIHSYTQDGKKHE